LTKSQQASHKTAINADAKFSFITGVFYFKIHLLTVGESFYVIFVLKSDDNVLIIEMFIIGTLVPDVRLCVNCKSFTNFREQIALE